MFMWESWSPGLLIFDVVLVHIDPLLDSIRFNTKVVESYIPGFGMDSGPFKSLINFNKN